MALSRWMLLVGVVGCNKVIAEPICDPGAVSWSAGTASFTEATDAFGLRGVEGSRVVAVDFDGDGWIDLHIHRGGLGSVDEWGDEGVRRSWLLRNDQGKGFIDVTEASGFRATRGPATGEGRPGSVVAFGDVDNDGDLDAFTAVNDLEGTIGETSELLINNGDGTFTLGSADLPMRQEREAPAGATFLDYDRDGNLDLWVPQNSLSRQPQQDHLYRGDGQGGFVDVTADAGLTTKVWGYPDEISDGLAHTNAWSSNACDLNGDGDVDLLAASYGRAPNHMWQNNGGSFTNRSVASGYAFDGGQNYKDNQWFMCWCTSNASDPQCEGVGRPAIQCPSPAGANWRAALDNQPYRLGGNSGATSCADIDNDGDIDLLTGEIKHWWAGSSSDGAELLINDGSGDVVFERPGNEALGLTRERSGTSWDQGDMTNTTFDFDNDRWPDVFIGSSDYTGTRSLLWHQDSKLSFSEVATEDFFEHFRSHGVAVADFDRDGDVDVVVGNSRSRCGGTPDCYERPQVRLFLNDLAGNFIELDLEGAEGTNKAAIGARVSVKAGDVTQTIEVSGGYGHYGAQNPHRLHAGLGPECQAEVTVRWPDGSLSQSETYTLPAGHRYRIVQGQEPTLAESAE